MDSRKLGRGLLILGFCGASLAFLADLLPGGKAGIQAAQILGIEISLIAMLAGAWLALSAATEKIGTRQRVGQFIDRVIHWPVLHWVLAGLLLVYVLFFIAPMFLNDTLRMRYFTTYLPDRYPIGNDLIAVLELMQGWFSEGQSPYLTQFYPPFTYVFFAPLLLVTDYPLLYTLFTLLNLACFVLLTLVIPLKLIPKQGAPVLMLIFATGLVSYGLQFELERGQYNVFTFLLCLWAIYLFHFHRNLRPIAYLLFSISIQLKLYPAIFIVMFVEDWRNWRENLKRLIGLGVFNVLLLFIMGPRIFLDFLHSVSTQLNTPGWAWNGNHSIKAFVEALARDGLRVADPRIMDLARENPDLLSNLLLGIFLITFVLTLYISVSKNEKSLSHSLLLVCMIGALTIPISNDYTLSILAAPLALFLCNISTLKRPTLQFISGLSTLGISIAYFATLVPFKYKPYFLNNTFPLLFVILLLATVIIYLQFRDSKLEAASR